MRVSYKERCELIEFLLDEHQCADYAKERSICFELLKVHQVHKKAVKIHNKMLKDFIQEIREL